MSGASTGRTGRTCRHASASSPAVAKAIAGYQFLSGRGHTHEQAVDVVMAGTLARSSRATARAFMRWANERAELDAATVAAGGDR